MGGISEFILQKIAEFGPRPSASEKEREFLLFLKDMLASFGLTTNLETFRAPATYTWAYLVFFLGLAQAGLLCVTAPVWAALSSLTLLVLLYFELATFPVVSLLFRTRTSANVLGKHGEHPQVIILAHADSATPSIFFHPRFVVHPRLSLLLFISSACVITGVSVALAFVNVPPLRFAALLPSLYLLFLASGHVHREFSMAPSPGGNDNGSGVAAALAIAQTLKAEGIPFLIVLTGAEESGTWGALHLLARHRTELLGKPIVNLDNIGIGTLTAATKEGMWRVYGAPQELLAEFQAMRLPYLAFQPYLGLSTDATPLLARGFKALTLIAFGEHGLPVNWHWYTDTAEAVDRENVKRVVDLVTLWAKAKHHGMVP
uniref:M28 family peptidase n=1 Tax=Candidatus Caldatribacterium saccharofermentans TaxID=1454753 RepID=A0A7V4WK91_9BACT